MRSFLFLALLVVGCAEETFPGAPGGGNGRPPLVGIGGGPGGSGGSDGGVDAGPDGGDFKGACDNGADLDAIENAGDRIRNLAQDCGLFSCINLIGIGQQYANCVSGCVESSVQGLSAECAACYGSAEQCGVAAFCGARCQSNTCSTDCLDCLESAGCLLDLEECRGLPGDGCPDSG
ncbi:MAG: hypothetical protein WBM46_04370 [Polyangiales bacterium]|jgi:hypothetical protein